MDFINVNLKALRHDAVRDERNPHWSLSWLKSHPENPSLEMVVQILLSESETAKHGLCELLSDMYYNAHWLSKGNGIGRPRKIKKKQIKL